MKRMDRWRIEVVRMRRRGGRVETDCGRRSEIMGSYPASEAGFAKPNRAVAKSTIFRLERRVEERRPRSNNLLMRSMGLKK